MRGRSRGAIGIRREELVSVLHGVAGGRMGMLVVSVVLPPVHILRGVVGLAVHRGEQRGRWTQNATLNKRASDAVSRYACPSRGVTFPFSAIHLAEAQALTELPLDSLLLRSCSHSRGAL